MEMSTPITLESDKITRNKHFVDLRLDSYLHTTSQTGLKIHKKPNLFSKNVSRIEL